MQRLSRTPSASPIGESERFELIDALRGFALAGVLLVNLDAFTLYAFLDDAGRAALPTASLDRLVDAIKSLLVDEKAITVFSMLFGLGFALQLERAQAYGPRGLRLYLRRLGVLLLFGLVHSYLFWWGDILVVYALMGFLLVLCRKLSLPALLLSGLLVALVFPVGLSPWLEPLVKNMPPQAVMERDNLTAFLSPRWSLALRQNVIFSSWAYTAWWTVWPFVLGRFLLGYWAGRVGLLQQPEKHRRLLIRIFIIGAIVGTAGTMLEYFDKGLEASVSDSLGLVGSVPLQILVRAGSLGLGSAYAAGFALLFLHEPARRYLRLLAPIGRMALSNYVAQTAICLALFYGVGLGIGPKFGLAGILSAWIVVFVVQIVFSRWWLSRYRFGPMEWLWRSLTYGNRQPMSAIRTT